MKILFWKNKKSSLRKVKTLAKPVSFEMLDKEGQDRVLKQGAKKFSRKYTKIVEELSNQ